MWLRKNTDLILTSFKFSTYIEVYFFSIYFFSVLEGYAKVFGLTFYFIAFLILRLCFYLFVYSKYTLWQFQNGKVGLYRPKIDQDTRNNVKIRKLKNNSFCSKNIIFEQKLLFFNFGIFTRFLVSWSIFGLYRPTLPFWNYQSVYFGYTNIIVLEMLWSKTSVSFFSPQSLVAMYCYVKTYFPVHLYLSPYALLQYIAVKNSQ